MHFNENLWNEIRSSYYNYSTELMKEVFEKFFIQIKFHDTFAYELSYTNKTLIIYTAFPGIWIGKHGKNVEILKQILNNALVDEFNIEFKYISGKFMSL